MTILGEWVKYSSFLTDFNISNNKISSEVFGDFLYDLARNKSIRNLNISNNKVVPKIIHHKRNQNEDEENILHTLKYLCVHLLRNPVIQHVDFSNIGLRDFMIFKICNDIKSSNLLQSIHFSANPGVTDEVKEKVCQIFEF